MKRKKILILTISPFTLLESLALVKSNNKLNDKKVLVAHYEHTTNLIDVAEKYMCSIFNLGYIGNLGRVEHLFKNLNFLQRISLFFTKLFLTNNFQKHLNINFNDIDHVIIPYRPYFSDVILTNLIPKNIKLIFVSDGYLINHPTSLRLNIFQKFYFFNMYKYEKYNLIYCLKGLDCRMNKFGNAKLIDNQSLMSVIDELKLDTFYNNHLRRNISKENNNKLFISQNFFPRFIGSLETEVDIFTNIIVKEYDDSRTIYIKYHPRDNQKKKELLNYKLKEYKNIKVLEDDFFSALPLEILIDGLKIKNIVGFNTTAIATIMYFYNDISVNLYYTGIDAIDKWTLILSNDFGIEGIKV